jgi:GT2 family glycosyltransferase
MQGAPEKTAREASAPALRTPDVSVVVVSFNTRDFVLPCLEALYRETRGVEFEVIVVDNASRDGSADAIESSFPQVRLLRSERNLGFAAANNLAAGEARGRYLLLLNPDTIVRAGTLAAVLRLAERQPEARIYGGRTLFADGTLNPTSCWGRPTIWSVFCRASGLAVLFRGSRLFDPESLGPWDRGSEREVDIVTGCFLLIPLAFWQRLGGFDASFFMYGEEVDLCLRARRLGARPRITPEATLVHHGGASEPILADKLVRVLGARARLMRVHWSRPAASVGVHLSALGCGNRWLMGRLLGILGVPVDRGTVHAWGEAWRRRAEWMGGVLPRSPA